jgi:hypothetical protein
LDFSERAVRRIRLLTIVVGVGGTVGFWLARGARPAAGFLMGAALSILNFQGLSMLANTIGRSSKPGPVAAVLIALRYVLIGCALYVIVMVLRFTPMPVLAGLLASFGAVILEIFYELIFLSHE